MKLDARNPKPAKMTGKKPCDDSDMFPVVNAESLGAEVLLPALPPVKDLKPKAGSGISQTQR